MSESGPAPFFNQQGVHQMQTGTQQQTGKGKGFPQSPDNPDGYTQDERQRTLKGKEKESVRGRKDQGQESVIKLESLQTKVDHLVKLNHEAESAHADYNDAVKAVAESSGLLAATVNKYVKARVGDKFEEAKTKALQLALVFEECGQG